MAKIILQTGRIYATKDNKKEVLIFEKGDPFWVGQIQNEDGSRPQEFLADGSHISASDLDLVREIVKNGN